MSACNFSFPLSGPLETILEKAKTAIVNQGGTFNGDGTSGNFDLSIFGNLITGTYTVDSTNLYIVIQEKPFLIPCSAIESFLKKQLT